MAAKDAFPGQTQSINAPAFKWKTVTPHDTNELADGPPKCLHIGGGAVLEGSIALIDVEGNTATFYGKQGDFLPVRPKIIKSTGTTASLNIIALY